MCPPTIAAAAAAPAPSTSSLWRSSSRLMVSTISSSVTDTSSSTVSRTIGNVSAPGRFTAMPSAIVSTRVTGAISPAPDAVDHRAAAGRLDADDPDLRPQCAQRDRDARQKPAAAARHDHDVEVGELLVQLEPDGALAGDHELVVERRTRTSRPSRRRARGPRWPTRRTSRRAARSPRRSRVAPILAIEASTGMKMVAGTPSSWAASATPCAWLPALAATTPRGRCSALRAEMRW